MDVKAIARQKGMTMEQIANRLGITKGGLSKALNGNPTLKTLRSVAEILGVPVTDLFADEEEPKWPTDVPAMVCPHCGKGFKLIKIEEHEYEERSH